MRSASVSDTPWHFDLYRVDEHQQIKIEVPLHFQNHEASPGLKRGGTLNIALHTVTVSCAADHIPEELVFDLTGKEIGDSIRVSDLKLPANVESALPADTTLASLSGLSTQTTSDEAADAATAGAAAVGGEG